MPENDAFTPLRMIPECPAGLPMHLKIHAGRVALLTVIVVSTLVAVTYILWDGFTIATVESTRMGPSQEAKLLSSYNSYSGSIMSVVSMPFHMLVNLILPVFFLCFATSWVLSEKKTLVGEWAPQIAAAGALWLLDQGFHSINVQFESPTYTFVISASDLVSSRGASMTTELATSTITSTVNVTGHATNNTLLRSSYISQAINPQTVCLENEDHKTSKPTASIIFGYSTSAWTDRLLPESVARDTSVPFTMTSNVTQVDVSALPDGDVNQSAILFTYGFYMMWQQFASPQFIFTSLSLYNEIKADDGVQLLKNIQNTMQNATDQVASNMNTSMWANLSHSEISMEFSSVRLSPSIKFDAITFELPVSMKTMAEYYFGTEASSNFSVTLSTSDNCSDNACILETPNEDATFQDQVRLFRICHENNQSDVEDIDAFGVRSCESIANSSVLLYSVARYISADEYSYDLDAMNLTIKNLRKTFSVTAGRLSWNTTDLAEHYDATCDAGANCNGLYFPLVDNSEHVVLGENHIPAPNEFDVTQNPFTENYWQTLALANTQTTSTTQGDLFYPPNYKMAAGSEPWTNLSSFNCSFRWSTYVTQIAQDHLYSTDSYQPAYAAGLFWLFQNAAAQTVVQTTSTSADPRLFFNHTRTFLSSRVSMPTTAAYRTYAGCALLLVLGTMVAFSANKSSHPKVLTQNFSVQNVAAVIIDTNQYPPMLVQGSVATGELAPTRRDIPSSSFCAIEHIRIVNMSLDDRTVEKDHAASSSVEFYTLSES